MKRSYENEVKILTEKIDKLWESKEKSNVSSQELNQLYKRVMEIGDATADEWGYCSFNEETLQVLFTMMGFIKS